MRARRILLADDDPEIQRTVQRLAAQHGCEIIGVTSGARVKAMALDAQPDVIVLDITFPDADGREVLTQLKADPLTRHFPILMWSARDPESDRQISLQLGAEDYVEKSDVGNLFAKLNRMFLRIESS